MSTVVENSPRDLSFEVALADALDRCERGETATAAAARFPAHDLLPCLELAQQLRELSAPLLETSWFNRSLERALQWRSQ